MSRVLVIDFETANSSATSACAIGAVLIENDEITEKFHSFIKPPSSLFQFTYIHGITWEQVKDSPTFKEMWEQGFGALYEKADLIVAHNIGFDSRVMKATAEHYQIILPHKPTDCTVKIARSQLEISPAKLNNVCDVLKIPLKHHEALSDSLASAYIYLYAKTGQKPWLTGKSTEFQYEMLMEVGSGESVPFTALPKKSKELADSISAMNSEKSKELLASLLKRD